MKTCLVRVIHYLTIQHNFLNDPKNLKCVADLRWNLLVGDPVFGEAYLVEADVRKHQALLIVNTDARESDRVHSHRCGSRGEHKLGVSALRAIEI